jgi:hypothetical protein
MSNNSVPGALPLEQLHKDPTLDAMPASMAATYTMMNQGLAIEACAYPTRQRLHVERSRQAIARTALTALEMAPAGEPKRALLLGGGNCTDIPLAAIVDTFDHTTLVDSDTESIAASASRLPRPLLGKISLVGADVTGVMAELTGEMERLAAAHTTHAEFAETAAEFICQLDPTMSQPDLGHNYSFVCSQLLLSQLLALPIAFLSTRILEQKYGQQLTNDAVPEEVSLFAALQDLDRGIQLGHLSWLRRLASPRGTVHFADTYTKATHLTGGPRAGTLLQPYIVDETINPVIDQHFTTLRLSEEWLWQVAAHEAFVVVSHALTPQSTG